MTGVSLIALIEKVGLGSKVEMEDLQRALEDRSLAVSTLPEKGHSLFATRDFYPGEVIISQERYVCVPNNSSVSAQKRCDGCFTTANLSKCSRCQAVWYCGTACQKSEWKLHRLECDALTMLDNDKRKSVTPSIRLMVKLYIRRKLQDEKANLKNNGLVLLNHPKHCYGQLQVSGGISGSHV